MAENDDELQQFAFFICCFGLSKAIAIKAEVLIFS